MNTTQLRLTLLGLALGILIALFIVPQTRWLVRLQALTVLHQYHPLGGASYSASPVSDTRAYDAVAARHPDDIAIQDARATVGENAQPLLNLRALTHRFPNSPMLHADTLREESRRLNDSRPDTYKLANQPMPDDLSHLAVPSPGELAAYDKEAAAGERIDPDNAYFPLMRAYGLFAARHDTEALAAVERASVKPIWNEYLTENVEAQWRLHTEAFGAPGSLPQSAIWSLILLPEYQRLRETARIAVYQAVLKEQAGHREEGYQLREAVRRCGDTMRVQSTTAIGSLVGIAISAIAETRPGGPAPKDDPGLPPEQMAQNRLNLYCAYVTKIGHPEAAQKARNEEAVRRTVQGLMKDDPQMLRYITPIRQLVFLWMAGVTLLLNTAWLLVLGLLAAGRARLTLAPRPPIGWKSVLARGVLAVGAWLVLALLFVCVSGAWITLVYHAPVDWSMTFGVAGAFGLAAWLVIRGLLRLPPPQRKGVFKTAALLPVVVGAVYGLYWLVQWGAWPLAELPQGLRTLLGSGENSGSDADQALQAQTFQLCALASLAVPLLLALGLGTAAFVRRGSVLGTLTAGFRRLAVPIFCLLVIAYGGILIGTERQERRVTTFNRQIISEGGRYFAAQAGQPWPGPVR